MHRAQHQLHRAILSLLPYTVCRASHAGCELLPCSSQGCCVAGWEAAELSASPYFAWSVWRPIAALCDQQGCSASTKTALKTQSVEPTELSCSFQALLSAQLMASQCHWITAVRAVSHCSPIDKKKPILVQISTVPQEAVPVPSLNKLFYS